MTQPSRPLNLLFVPPLYTYAYGPGFFLRHESAEEFTRGEEAGLWGARETALSVTEDVKDAIKDLCLRGVPKVETPTPGGDLITVGAPGATAFDSLGQTDNARVTAVNTFFRENRNGVIMLPAREIVTQVQLEMWSGFAMMGSIGVPAREYGKKTRWRYNGPDGSVFKWVDNRGRQSYPGDGSPRDGSVVGVEFVGGAIDLIPRTATLEGKTLWYWLFHNIGINGLRSAWMGYGNGTVFGSGVSHFQAFSDTLIDVGGSEIDLFGGEFSFMDSKNLAAGKPMIRFKAVKSYIRHIMITTRKDYLALDVYGGHGCHINGVCFDSQDSDPTYGSAIVVNNHDGLDISRNDFKGMALRGGPIIDIRNGRDIMLMLNNFVRKPLTAGQCGPGNTPLVKVAGTVGDNKVQIGPNGRGDYDGRILSARFSQIVKIDPSFKYEIG